EYTGLRFALFLLAEYAGIVVFSALTAVLFLGGWRGPAPDQLGWLWTLLKTFAVSFVVIWVRVSYPRLREDQLQRCAWQVLVPLALAQLVLTGVGRVAMGDRTRSVLDRFAIDFSLCMYCGICIEVCPFDALLWSPQFAYSELDIRDLTHERDRLGTWMATVPPPPPVDAAAEPPKELLAATK